MLRGTGKKDHRSRGPSGCCGETTTSTTRNNYHHLARDEKTRSSTNQTTKTHLLLCDGSMIRQACMPRAKANTMNKLPLTCSRLEGSSEGGNPPRGRRRSAPEFCLVSPARKSSRRTRTPGDGAKKQKRNVDEQRRPCLVLMPTEK